MAVDIAAVDPGRLSQYLLHYLLLGKVKDVRIDTQYNIEMCQQDVAIRLTITDKDLADSLPEGDDDDMTIDDMEANMPPEPETPPGPMRRPSTLTISIGNDACNLQVCWDVSEGAFVLESTCVICSYGFKQLVKGFQTKALIIAAHRLGYELAGHFERHRTFEQHLAEMQQKGE